MTLTRSHATVLGLSLILAAPAIAQDSIAEEAPPSLEAAEEAYRNIDYEQARTIATQAVEAGGNAPAQVARLYNLLGTVSALLEDEQQALDAYKRALALDTDIEMDAGLPPRLRTPFLQARGWWASQPARLGARLRVVDPGAAEPIRFSLELTDPLEMGSTLRLRLRPRGATEYSTREVEASPRTMLRGADLGIAEATLEDAEAFEYALTVLDGRGNQLLHLGTEAEPAVGLNPRTRASSAPTSPGEAGGENIGEAWWLWTIVGVLVAGGVAVGVYFAIPPTRSVQTTVSFGL